MSFVKLGEIVHSATVERAGERDFAVLSMTRAAGLVPQASVFKKKVASRDLTKYKIVRPNQLVVGIHIDEGALGFSGPEQEGIVSPAYKLWDLTQPETVYIPYLDRFIRSETAIRYFVSKYRETAERRGKLTNEQFLALGVPLPPLPEQKRIAAILDAADALRAKRRESLKQLDQLLQSTFLEMFGDPVTNPKGWKTNSLDNFGVFKNGLNFRKGESGFTVKYLGVGDFGARSMITDIATLSVIQLDEIPSEDYFLRNGDLVFVRSNGNKQLVGRCIVISPGDHKVTYSGFCIRYRLDSNGLSPYYLTHLFRVHSFRKSILHGGQGANIQNINQKILSNLTIPIPLPDLQQHFATIVESIEQQKARYRTQLDELDTLFASLTEVPRVSQGSMVTAPRDPWANR